MKTEGPEAGDARAWRERAAACVQPAERPVRLRSELVHEILAHARECYPEECCGLVLRASAGLASAAPEPELALGPRVVRCTNVQSRRYSRGESELRATEGFWIDERELLVALRDADRRNESLAAIYHSHVNTAAYLSHTDRAAALGPRGEPLWPETAHLIVSVFAEGARELAWFEWDAQSAEFIGRRVEWGES